MKGDLPTAAFRLLATLPVKTHEARLAERRLAPQQKPGFVKPRKASVFGKGGKARPVRIGRCTFESVSVACRALHKSTGTVYRWLRTGEAEFV